MVIDIRMPPTHTTEGLDAARSLKATHPAVGVLVLSAHVETHYAVQLLESGQTGSGYLLKERVTDVGELTDAVRRVAAGGVVIDPAVVTQLVSRRREHNPLDALSERERDVLEVMAQGRSNQAIGEQLFLSPKTVEAYVRSVFQKLDLHQDTDDNRTRAGRSHLPAPLARVVEPSGGCGDRSSVAVKATRMCWAPAGP